MNVLDLFSGIGGFSLGLERAGMKTVAFCEMDEHCHKVLRKNWPEVPIVNDVKKLNLKTIEAIQLEAERCARSSHELSSPPRFKNIDLICGGFPCQDISVAGKKEGLKGERSGLWKEFKRLIKEIEPRYAVIENVANLRANGLKEVITDLWKIGYDCEWHIISARSIGAPHLRERIWIIAYPSSKSLEGQRITSRVREKPSSTNGNNDNEGQLHLAHGHDFRLWKPFASEEEAQRRWTETASSISHWKEDQSIVCGVDDGISRGMDRARKQRIKQLGNAVLPQIPELIGKAIMEFEGLK